MSIPLSVLDQSPIREGGNPTDGLNDTIRLARLADRLGYRRYWVAEHHGADGFLGCSPEVMVARLGAETESIRIGAGGVMLPYYSPYKVAENFKLLSVMYPGRVDIGVGRAPGADSTASMALYYGSNVGPEYFPNKVADLQALLNDETPPTGGLERAVARPRVDPAPHLWMLGSSEESAGLAAQLGLPYSFAYFINNSIDPSLFSRYRARFLAESGNSGSTPYASLGVFVICADTEAEALRLARSRELWFCNISSGDSTKSFIPSVESAEAHTYTPGQQAIVENTRGKMVLGTPEQVKSRLTHLAEQFGADELVVLTITYDFEARCRSYELLAEAWSLGAIRL